MRTTTSATPKPIAVGTIRPDQVLLEQIARECGSVHGFTDGVIHMAAVIEAMYHVAEKAYVASDGTDDIDWRPLITMLRASRAKFPNIYSALGDIKSASESPAVVR